MRPDTPRVVLVVEDDPLLRIDAVMAFELLGWETLDCPTAELALDLVEGRSVDVLFTDIQLGAGLSGWDLAATLRDKLPDIVVLFASGDASDRSGRVRGSTFFRKPYDLADVADTCQSMLASPDDKH